MNIQYIAGRVAEGIVAVDSTTGIINTNRRTHEQYLPGVRNLDEPQFVSEVMNWWAQTYPADFGTNPCYSLNHPYPDIPNATCDLVLYQAIGAGGIRSPEWAVEFKYIRLVGDNGKNNDYSLTKALSPYLKDRSLIHDVTRLRSSSISQKKAAIMYGFDYDETSIKRSAEICDRIGAGREYSANLARVLRSVDPEHLIYSLEPIQKILNDYLQKEALVDGDPAVARFTGANRHPCGGNGRIVAWKIGGS
jgi:hypothetical protein